MVTYNQAKGLSNHKVKGEEKMTYEEARAAWNAECDEIARECSEEGYPSHGSNYDLRADEAWRYWEGLIDEDE